MGLFFGSLKSHFEKLKANFGVFFFSKKLVLTKSPYHIVDFKSREEVNWLLLHNQGAMQDACKKH